jgi:hypothetical protein
MKAEGPPGWVAAAAILYAGALGAAVFHAWWWS